MVVGMWIRPGACFQIVSSRGPEPGSPARVAFTRAGVGSPRDLLLRSLPAGDGADHKKGLFALRDALRQRMVGRFERPIFAADEEAQKGPALERIVIADRAAQHGLGSFERVQNGSLRGAGRHV